MFMQPMAPTPQGMSRPFVVGLVMLLLFLSMQADWGATKQAGRRAELQQGGLDASPRPELPSTREKIIYDLSVSNDRLERENWQMRQHILDLRRALRKEGYNPNSTLFTFPELEKSLQAANDTQRTHFDRHRPKHHSLERPKAEQRSDASLPAAEAGEEKQEAKQEAKHSLRGFHSSSSRSASAKLGPLRFSRLLSEAAATAGWAGRAVD